jgi:signal transduction histidine kinase
MQLTHFDALVQKNELIKVRIFLVLAAVVAIVFYFVMRIAYVGVVENLEVRIATAVVAMIGLVLTYIYPANRKFIDIIFTVTCLCLVSTYMYLLYLNHWSVFYRWAYFTVAIVLAAISISWRGYLILLVASVGGPILINSTSPLEFAEAFHFHSANLAVFLTMGVGLKSFLNLRKEFMDLTHELTSSSQAMALGKIAAGMAHEINNPLTIVNGGLSRLKHGKTDPADPELVIIHRTEKAVFRINAIIDSLIRFTTTQKTEDFESVNLRQVMEEIITLTENRMQTDQISIETEFKTDDAIVMGHLSDVRLAALQIFNNAMDAVKNKSRDKKILIRIESVQKNIHLAIIDNGKGLPAEIENSLMKPFHTVNSGGVGRGLGLSIAYGIVTKMGGKLTYQRLINQTQFEMKFPTASD